MDRPPDTGSAELAGLLSALGSAVDAAVSAPLWRSADRELAQAAVTCARLVGRCQGMLVRVLGELDARDLPARSGASSTAAWTRHELNLTPREARALASVATTGRKMPATGAALTAGQLNLAQADAITTAIGELPEDLPTAVRDQAEAELIERAGTFDAGQLSRLGAHILTVVAPEIGEARDGEVLERQERRARARRELFLTSDGHGTVHLRGRLTEEAAAMVRAALDPLAAPLPRTADGPDPRCAAQRRADALEELSRRALVTTGPAAEGTSGAGSQVFVTIPLRALTDGLGGATLPDGVPLSATAARRMACAADIIPAVLGAEGAVLDVGRAHRLFTGGRRRALILRDRGCAFPGCDRPPQWCDGHHILGFARGGSTALGNGVLLCGFHHHVVHHDGWEIVLARDGVPEFIPPHWLDPDRTPRRNHRHR